LSSPSYGGSLDQTLTLPTGPGSLQLSYWISGSTGFGPWGSGYGFLSVSILDAATNQVLRTIKAYNAASTNHLLWLQDRFGLGDLKGQRVKIRCDWDTQFSFWRLDDFAVVLDPSDATPLPIITSFSPASGNPGDPVILTGSGFTGAAHVAFNGLEAPFTVGSDTQITTMVPKSNVFGGDSVTTGRLMVNTPVGSGFSAVPFQVLRPMITAFSPMSCKRGAQVVLTGSGFTGCTSVTFDGMAGPATVPASFTIDGDSQITVTVPPAAITGNITVDTPYGGSAAYPWLTILPDGPVSVVISPRLLAVVAGATVTFTATVIGDIDQRVTWHYTRYTPNWSAGVTDRSNPLTMALEPTAIGDVTLRVYWGTSGDVSDSLTIPVKTLDFLGTGIVDVLDMMELAKAYGSRADDTAFDLKVDLNGDGVIDDADVSLFMDIFPRIQP